MAAVVYNLFLWRPGNRYCQFCGPHSLCCNYSTLLWRGKSSHGEYLYKWLWLHPTIALFTKIGSKLVGVGSRLANPWSKSLTVADVSAPRMVHLAICCWPLAGDSPSSLLLKCPHNTTACISQCRPKRIGRSSHVLLALKVTCYHFHYILLLIWTKISML